MALSKSPPASGFIQSLNASLTAQPALFSRSFKAARGPGSFDRRVRRRLARPGPG
jgi:hypothetical protein